jgi:hypothetical protein
MKVNSTKFVNLKDGSYRGIWFEYLLIIPFVENNEDMEIPVSRGTPIIKHVIVVVTDNIATFEEN